MRARRTQAMPRSPDPARSRAELAECLRRRRGEIEEALLTRTYTIAEPAEAADPEYVEGLRATVSAALEYGLAAVEQGEGSTPVPILLLAQARLAARNGVSLDTVLRRYFAGYTLLSDFLVSEARKQALLDSDEFRRILRGQAALFDQLLAAVSEEHRREAEKRIATSAQRRIERIERLLAGELLDASGLGYDFGGWNLGVMATGSNAAQALREAARTQDCRLLLARPEEDLVWAWLGSRRPLDPDRLRHIASSLDSSSVVGALGEPAEGLSGWRVTHRQARAAHRVALRSPASVVRYANVALLASALQDDLLCVSLHEIFLAPLEEERDGGEALREALNAYFSAKRNVSAAAAALGVSRNTIAGRLEAVERRLGRPLVGCATNLEVALRLLELSNRPRFPLSNFPDNDLIIEQIAAADDT